MDNVIAEAYKGKRPKIDPGKLKIEQTQTGEWNLLEERKGQRLYEKETNENNEFDQRKHRNNKMRGRKDKYYE